MSACKQRCNVCASIGYQLAPLPQVDRPRSGTPIAIYILITAVISIAGTAFLKDYIGKDVSAEYDH
jgi:hypothetical protein